MDVKLDDGCGYFYDVKDANVLYFSLHESLEDIDWYDECFGNKRLRVITKDLPLVGYKSVANRSNDDCWFFMMKNPFTRVRSKKEWIESVLGAKDLTMDHVYSYFGEQLFQRKAYKRKDMTETIIVLEKLVNERF